MDGSLESGKQVVRSDKDIDPPRAVPIHRPAPPGGESANTFSISPTAGIVGGSTLVADHTWPAAWKITGPSVRLQRLPGSATSCWMVAVSDFGWACGWCDSPNRSALWRRLDPPIDLGTLGDHGADIAIDINELGEIVGRSANAQRFDRPYLWRNGEMIDIGIDPPDQRGTAYGINDRTEIVGYESEPFRWHDGEMTRLPTFRSCFVLPRAVNNLGLIVGRENMDDRCRTGYEHAVVWENDGSEYVEYDLNDSIPRHPGTLLKDAKDVNSAGQMAIYGENENGDGRGYLVTPCLFQMSDPVPGIAGQPNTITVTGLQSNQRVKLIVGTEPGAQQIHDDCPGGLILIRNILASLPTIRADQNGTAAFTVQVSNAARGKTYRLQAAAPNECEISHTVTWTFE